MGVIVKAVVFALVTVISIGSSGTTGGTVMLQQITNSSVNILLACAYFLLIKATEYAISAVMLKGRHRNYDTFTEPDNRDDLSDMDAATETQQRHEDMMRRAEDTTVDLDANQQPDLEEAEAGPSSDFVSVSKSIDAAARPKVVVTTDMEEVWEVYKTVYYMGCCIFIVFYSIDMTNTLSAIALIMGMIIQQAPGTIDTVYRAMHDPDHDPVKSVNNCFTVFSYVCISASMVSFLLFTCTMKDVPEDMVICTRMTTPRVDLIFGILLPMLATIPVSRRERSSMDRIVIYKAAPFAFFIAFVTVVFMGWETVQQVTGASFRQISLFLLAPLFKGAAVVIFISSCMQDKRVETASILAFILFCKEAHDHRGDKDVLQGVMSGLVFSLLSLLVCIMKQTKCVFNTVLGMNTGRI